MGLIRHFDAEQGIITAEAGISLDEILSVIVPKGWFLPVTPGTKYVTLGGAVANDVHGKNHHKKGTFGCFVDGIGIYRSDKGYQVCSPSENKPLFEATIGGLGLTGVIMWVTLRLCRILSSFLEVKKIRFGNIGEYFEMTEELDKHYEYSVAWVDGSSKGKHLGRGIYSAAHFSEEGGFRVHRSGGWSVPFTPPFSLVNKVSAKLFNELYYRLTTAGKFHEHTHYDPFFYPLDRVGHWNRIYGKSGFQQFQCLIPTEDSKEAISEMLSIISASGIGLFLCVLKKCGEVPSPGLLSFPAPGVTIAVDVPQSSHLEQKLMSRLNSVVAQVGGRIYPAKDAQMSAQMFQSSYPNWKELEALRDPALKSIFWERVTS